MVDYLRYSNQGATRRQPLNDKLTQALSYLADLGVTADVFSGGQPSSGPNRVGSHRHDHGNAGDVEFYKDGRKLTWKRKEDIPVLQNIVAQGKARGITGWGAGDGYMGGDGRIHLGYGSPSVWGAGGKGANAAGWLRQAYNGGAGMGAMADGPKGTETYVPDTEFTGAVPTETAPVASLLANLLGGPPQEMMSAGGAQIGPDAKGGRLPDPGRFGPAPGVNPDMLNGTVYGPEQREIPTAPFNDPNEGIQGPTDGTQPIEMAGGALPAPGTETAPPGLLARLLGGKSDGKGGKQGGLGNAFEALAPPEPMKAPEWRQQNTNVPDLASLINAFMQSRGKA